MKVVATKDGFGVRIWVLELHNGKKIVYYTKAKAFTALKKCRAYLRH
jgi:hypothetical protein